MSAHDAGSGGCGKHSEHVRSFIRLWGGHLGDGIYGHMQKPQTKQYSLIEQNTQTQHKLDGGGPMSNQTYGTAVSLHQSVDKTDPQFISCGYF